MLKAFLKGSSVVRRTTYRPHIWFAKACILTCLAALFSGCDSNEGATGSLLNAVDQKVEIYHLANLGGKTLWDDRVKVTFSSLIIKDWFWSNGYGADWGLVSHVSEPTLEFGFKNKASYRYTAVWVGFSKKDPERYVFGADHDASNYLMGKNGPGDERWVWFNLEQIPREYLSNVKVVTFWLDLDAFDEVTQRFNIILHEFDSGKRISKEDALFVKNNKATFLEAYSKRQSVSEAIDAIIKKYER